MGASELLASGPSSRTLDDGSIADLKTGVRGEVLLPGTEEFDSGRRVFNALIDHRPLAIVQCHGVADVVHAVNFARTKGLTVSVRGGGHNVAGLAICDGGLVIDLSRMRGSRVDAAHHRLWVQGGATWADVDRETQLFGLASPGGLVSSTGVGGFTLGGGIGWLTRQYGLACDNLVGAELVTASGSTVRCSLGENPELLWALRGGGGNFGVVTGFEFELHEVGPVVYGGALFYRREDAVSLLGRYAHFARAAPERLTTLVALVTGPPAPFLPPDVHGKPMIAFAFCYNGSPPEGEAALRPLREALGSPVADLGGPIPYTTLQRMFDLSAPFGRLHYWKAHHLKALDAETAEDVVRAANAAPSPCSEVHLHQLGGQYAREPVGGSAYSNRDAPFVLNLIGQWTDRAHTEVNRDWARESWERLKVRSTGRNYLNFLAETDGPSVESGYGRAQFDRLRTIKDKYDPENFFRANHNVTPAGRPGE